MKQKDDDSRKESGSNSRVHKTNGQERAKSFLGTISFYRRYVKLLASDTATLSPATSKAAPAKILWTPEMESAFTSICKLVAQSCILTIPLPEDTMSIVTDASGSGIGGALQVK